MILEKPTNGRSRAKDHYYIQDPTHKQVLLSFTDNEYTECTVGAKLSDVESNGKERHTEYMGGSTILVLFSTSGNY